jgi:hypothetical protein
MLVPIYAEVVWQPFVATALCVMAYWFVGELMFGNRRRWETLLFGAPIADEEAIRSRAKNEPGTNVEGAYNDAIESATSAGEDWESRARLVATVAGLFSVIAAAAGPNADIVSNTGWFRTGSLLVVVAVLLSVLVGVRPMTRWTIGLPAEVAEPDAATRYRKIVWGLWFRACAVTAAFLILVAGLVILLGLLLAYAPSSGQ